MRASTGRALGLAAAVAGPLLAAVALGRQAITIRQLRAKLERDRPSIHAVPAVPPLWRQENSMSAAARFLPQSAATVPPENPHAPPTPPNGVTVRPTAHALRGR